MGGRFKIGKYEVTQVQWETIMGENPSKKSIGCDNCPVESVSWMDTQSFIRELNVLTGRRFRLPTEAEWEFAARGGRNSKKYKYAGSNNLDEVAWYSKTTGNIGTKQVGTKKPNELGLYDMSGNVYEWCSDWYNSDYYVISPQKNPKETVIGNSRILRGGAWNRFSWRCRVSFRGNNYPSESAANNGFRLVEDL